MDVESLKSRLDSAGQGHLMQFWDTLTDSEKQSLFNELNHLDFDEINMFFHRAMDSLQHASEKLDDLLEPLPAEVCGSLTQSSTDDICKYRSIGLQAVGKNCVAVLLLAGGQGTRLGVNYPKGMYNVGLPSGKTLYQIQAERILKLQRNAEKLSGKPSVIPWYIMTSESTKEPTLEYFKKNEYFGLAPENVVIFEQNLLPCMGFDGKIYMTNQHKVALAPDGNGGLYKALKSSKVLSNMEARGIQYVHVYCVDNILVKMADPVFMGFCINKGANCGAKVVQKASPTEAVGVVCKVEGKYQVVEYSEITLKTAERRNTDGQLTFKAGNICNHFFTLEFLKIVTSPKEEGELKHHVAKKKIPHVTAAGDNIKPTEPNGIKMEKFVFDVFQFATSFAVWEVLREDEFSPLKNADGAAKDTPSTCRQDLCSLNRRRVIAAGGKFVHKDGSSIPHIPSSNNNSAAGDGQRTCEEESDIVCEVSPLVSYDGEDLEELVKEKSFCPPLVIELNKDGSADIVQQNVQQNGK